MICKYFLVLLCQYPNTARCSSTAACISDNLISSVVTALTNALEYLTADT